MERVLNPSRTTGLVALLWPAGKPVDQDAQVPARHFTLVSTPGDYEALTAAGHNSILIQRRPSSHFSVPLVVRLAGPLIVPWRWRRLLLNEGITTTISRRSLSSIPLVIATLLARCRVTPWHASLLDQ